jgi:hypothetical protein
MLVSVRIPIGELPEGILPLENGETVKKARGRRILKESSAGLELRLLTFSLRLVLVADRIAVDVRKNRGFDVLTGLVAVQTVFDKEHGRPAPALKSP